ncbi:Site-specific DNA recombinase [Enhydrobacter aerosaccus]|uniref:Site-specific DNA recombinase n=1 Tax=Enhydrobacter aerosaccus TaxID=225324 RepID=A0A1T4TLK8_9HYPH|nr:Site-specific DNA recombinase [Enhydrobacter aerosaccus]
MSTDSRPQVGLSETGVPPPAALTGTSRRVRQTEVASSGVRLARAAQYVRMSTEHQRYSTENQSDAIRQYAERRGLEVVKTYADEGRSGLRLDGRDGLKQLIDDVQNGVADFSTILVYDVSRWGRFQDADESAYYEYICKRAGISVQYCAEQFENDGSPVSTIVKGVKRAMAGEYSRELSAKVFAGQCRLIEIGYRQGGPAGYGLRRMLIDQTGAQKGELSRGEHKSIQTDRVILVPGAPLEIETVRWMYRAFVEEGKPEQEIADLLNSRHVESEDGRRWTRGRVHQILTNPKYVGDNVWNRISYKLKKTRVRNAPDMWIRSNGAFEPIVERHLFDAAYAIIQSRSRRLSDEEMLGRLKTLYQARGQLSGLIIDEAEGLPSSSTYSNRFGSLGRAYQLVGYTPERDFRYVEINRALRELHPQVVGETIEQIGRIGGRVSRDEKTQILKVNDEFTVALSIARCLQTAAGTFRWQIRFDTGLSPDVIVAIRMDRENLGIQDYYILPSIDLPGPQVRLGEHNGLALDSYRFDTLEQLYEMAARTFVKDVQ